MKSKKKALEESNWIYIYMYNNCMVKKETRDIKKRGRGEGEGVDDNWW